jgi:hypothetical protein
LTTFAGNSVFDLLAPGLYAWAITVAWPAAQRLAPFESRLLAGGALTSLIAGALLTRFWPFAARMVGFWLFVACSLAVWALLARTVGPTQLDPVLGVLGSVGWATFAVVWGGERPQPDTLPAPARPTRWPAARRRTTLIMLVVATAAAIPIALAWWVQTTERALLAHAVSLAAGIALVARAADLAAPGQREAGPRPPDGRPKRRLVAAAWPLAAVAALALAGALFALLR